MLRRTPAAALFSLATVLFALALLAAFLEPLPRGLRATYFATPDWTGTPALSTIDAAPSSDALFLAWRGTPPSSFSVSWTGWIMVLRDGTYTFATASDDGSAVYVDGRLVVDNGGIHPRRSASGQLPLTRGAHRLLITYFQAGGGQSFDVVWGRESEPMEPLPSWALTPRATEFRRFLTAVSIRRAPYVMVWPWLATAAWWAFVAAFVRPVRHACAARDRSAAFEWALLCAGAVTVVFVLPHTISSDGFYRYVELQDLIERHHLSPIAYSIIGPLCSAPLYLLGKVAWSPHWWCERFNALVLVGGIAAAWQVVRGHIDAGLFRKFALLLLAATMFVNHLQNYFGDVFTAVLVATGLLAVEFGRPIAGWAAVIVGVANTQATLVAMAAVAAFRVWRTRHLRAFVPVAVAAAIIVAETWIRRGVLFDSGYAATFGNRTVLTYSGRPGFSYPFLFGVLSILFSFGKGLVFYVPGLLLPVRRYLRAVGAGLVSAYDAWLVFLAGLIAIYAKWWAWFGGWTWGPRFFLVAAFPASLALAVALQRRRTFDVAARVAILAVLTFSTWVAIDGAVFGLATLETCLDDTFASLCWYVPEFSPLFRPFVQFTRPAPASALVGGYFVVVYLWLAAPLVRDVVPSALDAASRAWTAATRGPSWRF